MTRAIAFGTFSIIHPGHIHYLAQAKKLADELIVVIARDEIVKKYKGENIVPENQRQQVVEALKPVDKAILGKKENKYEIIKELEPDYIVLGPDQEKNTDELKEKLREMQLNPKIIRIPVLKGGYYRSSKLLDHIFSEHTNRAKD